MLSAIRSRSLLALIVVAALGVTLVPSASAQQGARGAGGGAVCAAFTGAALQPQALLRRARDVVRSRATFRRAILLEADGTTVGGRRVFTASGITQWRFVYDNQETSGSPFDSVFIRANRGALGSPVGVTAPFLEDRRMAIPAMSLRCAVRLLRRARYLGGFFNVTLRYPLGPGFTEPLYIFGFGQSARTEFVSVGTRTGRVRPIS